MRDLVTVHTARLDRTAREAVRGLLSEEFDDLAEEDWEHGLGGLHALVREGGLLVGHASVVQRRMLHGGRALRTGYVENVVVRADRRGRGHGAALMTALEEVIRGGYELGALCAADDAARFYAARGWLPWRGPLAVLAPRGPVPTPEEEGAVFVLPGAAPPDLGGRLACDWRDGDVW
ncbi:GNAT family N-acetyltransferase [Streptomyces sp. BE20]|uniref:GNAT family N-acetyltransferase n=1 Tax=Streptomyces sp. BE20 TaxID=3002525 RepID=UPI002E763A03|nr:GNAT family N-acetyltransferase [Streptomyces sp. BE20]MEE1825673.1 GNAT family N-acetyltransferase [Streptomyces sp. BE20]